MSTSASPATELRHALFNEAGDMLPPFIEHGWRGCAIDRDAFDNCRLPQELFEAIVTGTQTSQLVVCGYFADGEACHRIPATWEAYRAFMLDPDHRSPEYIIQNEYKSWAILADFDTTIFGTSQELASAVDRHLFKCSTSLVALTAPLCSGLNPVSVNYFRAIAGAL